MELSSASNFQIVKGWFSETLPEYPLSSIALLRLDGDLYESTMDCFQQLYHKVVKGGIIIIDDYLSWTGCSRAVHDYLSSINSQSIIQYFEDVVYIKKNDPHNPSAA